MKRHLITSALPYANGYLHLGHIAGAYLPADIYARFLRLNGEAVLYICGSDEHGVAITIAAEKQGVSPQQIIDTYHNANLEAFTAFGWTFDTYARTSLPEHHELAQDWFLDFQKKGLLVEKEEDQFYDDDAKMFLPDRYVEGICPNCGFDRARGDQCDHCGAYYNQLELKEPKSLVSGKRPVVKKTTHWYYPLGRFQKQLEQYIESHASDWKENVLQQSRSWLKQGLGDRAITRDLTWGVPVPLERGKGKVLYVWFDAVLGYISATKIWAKEQGRPDEWKKWWMSNADSTFEGSDYVAFIGKDNIVFHTLMFPSMLMARNEGVAASEHYVVPVNVPANEFLNLEGQKFSKSRNWSIDLRDAMMELHSPGQRDSLRYAIAMNFPETRDSDFSWSDFQIRNNNELAAIFGNFVNRSLQFMHANFEGRVPTLPERYAKLNDAWSLILEDFNREDAVNAEKALELYGSKHLRYFNSNDAAFIAALHFGARAVAKRYREFRFRDALSETMNLARAANKYFNDSQPWKTVKSDRDECAKTLYICAQSIRDLAIAFAPVTPFSSEIIQKTLGISTLYSGEALQGQSGHDWWSGIAQPLVAQGQQLAEPQILFTKIEDSFIESLQSKLGTREDTTLKSKKLDTEEMTGNYLISIDDFKKIQLRTAKVLNAERVPKSDKLLKLTVDTGADQRQILAGIAKYYSPEDMIGKTVVVVVNLKPAKLMGLESQGMLLAANSESGLSIVSPIDFAPVGAEVR